MDCRVLSTFKLDPTRSSDLRNKVCGLEVVSSHEVKLKNSTRYLHVFGDYNDGVLVWKNKYRNTYRFNITFLENVIKAVVFVW